MLRCPPTQEHGVAKIYHLLPDPLSLKLDENHHLNRVKLHINQIFS